MGAGSKRERRMGGFWGLFLSRGKEKFLGIQNCQLGAMNERQKWRRGGGGEEDMMIKRDRWRGTF